MWQRCQLESMHGSHLAHLRLVPTVRLGIMSAMAVTEDPRMTGLGVRVREARERATLGANELDRKMGLDSVGYTSRIETGRRGIRVDPRRIRKMAEVLGVSATWLMYGDAVSKAEPTQPTAPQLNEIGEVGIADAVTSRKWTPQEIDAARVRMTFSPPETREDVIRMLREARSGAEEMKRAAVADQPERVDALRTKRKKP